MTGTALAAFLTESLMIEGIHRPPTPDEIAASVEFLEAPAVTLDAICAVQQVYAPGMPLRDRPGMNVRVGRYIAPAGGPEIPLMLERLADAINAGGDPWALHVEFERIHPFLDGNGRTGRIVWAWNMLRTRQDPFAIGFLHRWYYQTLAAAE